MHEDLKSLKRSGGRVGEVLWVAKEDFGDGGTGIWDGKHLIRKPFFYQPGNQLGHFG